MAGAFDESQKQSDEAKAAALAALARGGSAALAEHTAAQDQLAALRQQAATGALQRAAAIGAPAGLGEQQAAAGSGVVFDRYSQDQGRAGAARSQALADLASANSQYFSQVDAARPIVEGRAKKAWDDKEAARILAEQRAQQAELDRQAAAAARDQAQQWRVEDRQMKLTDRAAAAAEKQAAAMTPGKIIAGLGGAAVAGKAIQQAATTQAADFSERRGAAGPGSAPRPLAAIANQVASGAGLPQGYGEALLPKAPAAATPKQAAHRTDVTSRVKQFASPNTYDTFVDVVVGRPKQYDTNGSIIDHGVAPATTLAAAMSRIATLTDAQLKASGVSRTTLTNWFKDYFSV